MYAIFDTKTNKVVYTNESKDNVLEVLEMPENKDDYDNFKIVKIETCVKDIDKELKEMAVALKEIHKIICNCAKENPVRTPTLEEANDIYAWCCYGLNIGEGKGEE